jgi:hypothetical protein
MIFFSKATFKRKGGYMGKIYWEWGDMGKIYQC